MKGLRVQFNKSMSMLLADTYSSCLDNLDKLLRDGSRTSGTKESDWTSCVKIFTELRRLMVHAQGAAKEDSSSSSEGYSCLQCLIPCGQLHVFRNVSIGDGSYAKVFRYGFLGVTAAAKECVTAEIAETEAKLLARLQHPNVVNFIGLGGRVIVLELMSKDLRRYLDEKKMKMKLSIGVRPLSLLEAIDIMRQIGEALKYLTSEWSDSR
ncbi:unnamed protein product [Sphagnum compactum]